MIKIIAILSVSLCAALYGLYAQVQSSGKLKSEISQYKSAIDEKDALIEKERAEAQAVSFRAQKYYEQKAKDDEELEKLRTCYADKSCWPRVRIKTACPKLPSAATNAGAFEESTAELGENAGQDLLLLRDQIKETKRLVAGLQSELMARSAPDYCQPK